MTSTETAMAEIRAVLEFYANEYRVEDSGNRARKALALLSADGLVEVAADAICRIRCGCPLALKSERLRDQYVEEARSVLTALDIPRREAEAAEREREAITTILANLQAFEWMASSIQQAWVKQDQFIAAIRSRSQPAAKAQGGGG